MRGQKTNGRSNCAGAPAGKTLMKKTWGWFRHAAMLHRQHHD
jgi:hypothetical protein